MAKRSRRRVGAVVVALFTSACSLVTSLDGFSGGAAVLPDSASDADLAADDAKTSDAPKLDAGADASFACGDPADLLCDRFDDLGHFGVADYAGGVSTLESASFTSPPTSLRAFIPVGAGPRGAIVRGVVLRPADSATAIEVDLSLRVDALASSPISYQALLDVRIATGTDGAAAPTFGLALTTQGLVALQDGQNSVAATAIPLGEWVAVTLLVPLAEPGGKITVRVGSRETKIDLLRAIPRGTADLQLGLLYVLDPASEGRVLFDDLRIRAR